MPADTYSLVSDESLPPMVDGQNPAEPPAHEMAAWIWPYVGSGWTLEIFKQDKPGTDEIVAQALFLEAPDGDLFRLCSLSTDFDLQIEQWTASPPVAWINRFTGESNWLVELDLVADTVDESPMAAVEASGPPLADTVAGVGRDTLYIATTPAGREMWIDYDLLGSPMSVIWRNADGTFERSAIDAALTPLVEPWGTATGITLTSDHTKAVYLVSPGQATNPNPTWFVHDLVTDTWVTVSPGSLPESTDACNALGHFDGRTVVVRCGYGPDSHGYRVTLDGSAAPIRIDDLATVASDPGSDAYVTHQETPRNLDSDYSEFFSPVSGITLP